jgi:hypothetical protein
MKSDKLQLVEANTSITEVRVANVITFLFPVLAALDLGNLAP